MKLFPLFVVLLSLLSILTCKDKNASNDNVEKELAKIFFEDGSYMNVEEIRGATENRITCKQTIGSGILVFVRDFEGREFRLEIDNVTTTGDQFVTSYVHYRDVDGEIYETSSSGLASTEIAWWDNLMICTFKYEGDPEPLYSNSGHILLLDSFSIEALREDD